ncbi:MAG TPA: pyruvate dehydrogenase (acetyl-transferring) E1 component subunit alpha [Chthoniobacteraceae bacterium]|nr:acoA 1 [Chthoniobacter sp.]HEV7866912.1 pyruvate dehydrogenase (acetyl-transferring) E1 component subunit alpha [Chthoniobacteraceae bacterium]
METAVKAKAHAAAPINAKLTKEDKLGFLREMLRIRRFEQTALRQYQAGKMGGFMHLYIGQESIAIGTCSLMGDNDHVITAYRCHGHALGVGMSMNECMAELYGKATGCSKGKGGSMHFFAPDKNYWGGHGIVGGQTPLGLGLAYGIKYKGLKGAALCFLGDGAINQGVFYESLNMASLFDLPVIYIIENNKYSMGTSLERSSVVKSCLAERADAFLIDWAQANGEDLYEVRAVTQQAIERAHEKSRPTVLEFDTYRYYGHSVADAKHSGGYRTKEEIERYKNDHDPIQLFKKRLIADGILNEDQFDQISEEAKEEAEAAAVFAEESPLPSDASIFEDVYFETDRQTEAGRTGKHFFND